MVTSIIPTSNGRQIFNMTLPRKGPVDVPVTLDFQTDAITELDFTSLIDNGFVDYLSGVYFDNSNNPNDLIISCNGSTQRSIWPAFACGYLPLLITNPPKLTITSNGIGANVITTAHFYNIPMMPFITYPSASNPLTNVNISEVGGVSVTNAIPVTTVSPVVNPTVGGGTITLGGTAQDIITLVGTENRFLIQNLSTTDLYFRQNAVAVIGQPSLLLSSGQTYYSDYIIAGNVSLIGATTGQAFSWRTW